MSDDPDFEYLIIDSTIVRAHQHASGAKKGAQNQAIGRSRGGPEHQDPPAVRGLDALSVSSSPRARKATPRKPALFSKQPRPNLSSRCGLRCRSHPRNCSRERRPSREITLLNRKLVERMAQSIQLTRSARVTSSAIFFLGNKRTHSRTGVHRPPASRFVYTDTSRSSGAGDSFRARRLRPNTEAVWPARSSFLPGRQLIARAIMLRLADDYDRLTDLAAI